MMVSRLGRCTILPWEDHNLSSRRNVHPQPLLDERRQSLARGEVPDLALEMRARSREVRASPLELLNVARLGEADAPPPNHGEGDDDERAEQHREDAATLNRYAALRQTRSLALRARGFLDTSSAPAVIAFLVTTSPSAVPRQVQWGCFGGQTQSRLHSLIACLTIRSSPE